MTERQRLTRLALAAALAAAVVVAAILLSQGGAENDAGVGAAATEVETLLEGVSQKGFEAGEPRAPVVLIEFADLQCPFCAEFATETQPELIRRYVRGGDLRLVFRPLSFIGQDSKLAAEAAAGAALQDRGVAFAELFYLNQGTENSGYVTDDFLDEIASATPGLDADEALAAAGTPDAARLLAAAEQEARALGIDSTPTFLIGRRGEQPELLEAEPSDIDAFQRAIDGLRDG